MKEGCNAGVYAIKPRDNNLMFMILKFQTKQLSSDLYYVLESLYMHFASLIYFLSLKNVLLQDERMIVCIAKIL